MDGSFVYFFVYTYYIKAYLKLRHYKGTYDTIAMLLTPPSISTMLTKCTQPDYYKSYRKVAL